MAPLQSILLRLVSRNVQSIVDFVVRLDAQLDAFLEKHDAEVAAKEAEIVQIAERAEQTIADLRADIEAKAKAASVVVAIKLSLPKGD